MHIKGSPGGSKQLAGAVGQAWALAEWRTSGGRRTHPLHGGALGALASAQQHQHALPHCRRWRPRRIRDERQLQVGLADGGDAVAARQPLHIPSAGVVPGLCDGAVAAVAARLRPVVHRGAYTELLLMHCRQVRLEQCELMPAAAGWRAVGGSEGHARRTFIADSARLRMCSVDGGITALACNSTVAECKMGGWHGPQM